MKSILLCMVLFFSIGFSSVCFSESKVRNLLGRIEIWSKPACHDQEDCGLPSPLGIVWKVDLSYVEPAEIGATKVISQVYSSAAFSLKLEQIWVLLEGQSPYIVTQVRLLGSDELVLAECTRYDDAFAFSRLPPGNCAGRAGATIYGATFYLR